MSTLSIYILCHDRPDDARQAIRSVLAQTDQGFTLTVSDNSSNDEVERMVRDEFPQVNYVRRHPMLPSPHHFSRCIDEVRTPYFCLFHDDDLMGPDFVGEMKKAMQAYPQAIAFGCNAIIEVFGKPQAKPSFQTFRRIERIDSARDMAARYFARSQSGVAPFPGYVYNKKLVGNLRIPVDGGKYADVTWLTNLAKQGPILWINQPLITYRMHASNDGNVESRRDRLRSLAYLKKNRLWLRDGLLQDYRYSFIYKPIQKFPANPYRTRQRIASAFLRHYRWARYLRLDTYQALFQRALAKWMPKQ